MNITTKLDHISPNFIPQYLKSLGIKNVKQYLKPTKKCFEEPENYSGIDAGCKALNSYIKNKTPIYIIRDSDTDGDCSSAIIYMFLKIIGVDSKVLYHEGKQHGLEEWMIDEIEESSLILIPDASANNEKVISKINKKNCICIETDHHLTTHEDKSIITINNQRSPNVKNKDLSGAGVTDKFVRRYCDLYGIKYPNYTDLVAISLVSDICNLANEENRWYIYNGLKNITNPFINFLFDKCCKRRGYTPEAIGWNISPLANALARSNEQKNKTLFFDGLIGKVKPEEALKNIRKVKRLQDEEVKSVVEEIEPNLDLSTKVIVGFTSSDNSNFTGLIANKFTGKYNKPTILLRDAGYGSWSGSLRSPTPLATKINESGLASAQGHEEACGILLKKKNLESFTKWLNSLDLSEKPEVEVTAKINPEDITLDICQVISEWKQLWGKGIEAPTFAIETTLTKDKVFVFEKSSKTLKLDLGNVGCLKFFASDNDIEAFRKYDKFNVQLIVGDLGINEYEGIKTPQAMIKDYEIIPIVEEKEDWADCF